MTWIHRGRDAIEGLIPRDGVINAATHVGVGLAGAGVVTGVALKMSDEPGENPLVAKNVEFLRKATMGLAVPTAPLFLTAGMMLATGTDQALARGVTPWYFLAAGSVLGAAYITHSAADVLAN